MLKCPWCGTSYSAFRSNCSRCGGPVPPEQEARLDHLEKEFLIPPPAPRTISENYAWRLVLTNGWAVSALVFLLMGIIFFPLGILLTIGFISAFVGIPFAGLGLLFLGVGIPLFLWRYKEAQKTVRVLREGSFIRGKIIAVSVNPSVSINGRNPWTITYSFQTDGQDYQGKVSTLTPPGQDLQAGQPACVLFLPESPEINAIYPHP